MAKWSVLVVGLLAACSATPNPLYCDESSDCKNGFVCNLETHGCDVANDASVDATGSCMLDDECPSGVCRSDGSCESPENIIYVSPDGISAGLCPESARCDIAYALSKVSAEASTIRLANGRYELPTDLSIEGPGPDVLVVGGRAAAMARSQEGPVLRVTGVVTNASRALQLRGMSLNSGVECAYAKLIVERVHFDNPILVTQAPWVGAFNCDVEISGSELRDSNGNGVTARAGTLWVRDTRIKGSADVGVDATGQVSMERSQVIDNKSVGIVAAGSLAVSHAIIAGNWQGGVYLSAGSFDLVNNLVYRNGNDGGLSVPTSAFGGLRLQTSTTGSRIVHNTIVLNTADVSATPVLAGGVYCERGDASYNIVAQNFRGNAELQNAQTGGGCTWGNSLIESAASVIGFVDFIADDFHLASASGAINVGVSGIHDDFEGQPRSDGLVDVGADEFVP